MDSRLFRRAMIWQVRSGYIWEAPQKPWKKCRYHFNRALLEVNRNMTEKTVPERLAVIETEITNIKETLDDIKDNHLNSIYNKFDDIWQKFVCLEKKIISRLPLWVTMIITLLTSLCVGLIVYGVMRK